jgi:hypothetical protein
LRETVALAGAAGHDTAILARFDAGYLGHKGLPADPNILQILAVGRQTRHCRRLEERPTGFVSKTTSPFQQPERTVMLSIRNRWTAIAVAALLLPGTVLAQTPDHPSDNTAKFPTSVDLKALTTSGSYLAARHASVERDAASAAAFYRSALRSDPKNNELLDRAFISSVADGDIDERGR